MTDPLAEYFAARADLRLPLFGTKEWFAAQVMGSSPEPPPGGFLVPPGLALELTGEVAESLEGIRKIYGQIDVADELLNPRSRPPLPWRTRLRYRISDWRERVAERAYEIIAGHNLPEAEDWLWPSSPGRASCPARWSRGRRRTRSLTVSSAAR